MIQGIYTLSHLMASTSPVTSLLNTSLSVATTSQTVTIGGDTVTLANVATTNGLIHVIDKVRSQRCPPPQRRPCVTVLYNKIVLSNV